MLAVLPADVPADVFTAPLPKQLQGPGSSYLRGTTGTLDEKMSSSDEELSAGGADLSTGGGTHLCKVPGMRLREGSRVCGAYVLLLYTHCRPASSLNAVC